MLQDAVEAFSLFIVIVNNPCIPVADDTFVPEFPAAGFLIRQRAATDIYLDAAAGVPGEQPDLLSHAGGMDPDRIVHETETERDYIGFVAVDHRYPAHGRLG
jgi:hypothetical protein